MAVGETFRNANLVPGMALGNNVRNVTLVADNTFINVAYTRTAFLRLASDNATAASRTFTLSSGAIDGQVLYLHFISATSFTAQLADSGNCALSAAWEPLENDTLTLMWDATSLLWRELGRADN